MELVWEVFGSQGAGAEVRLGAFPTKAAAEEYAEFKRSARPWAEPGPDSSRGGWPIVTVRQNRDALARERRSS